MTSCRCSRNIPRSKTVLQPSCAVIAHSRRAQPEVLAASRSVSTRACSGASPSSASPLLQKACPHRQAPPPQRLPKHAPQVCCSTPTSFRSSISPMMPPSPTWSWNTWTDFHSRSSSLKSTGTRSHMMRRRTSRTPYVRRLPARTKTVCCTSISSRQTCSSTTAGTSNWPILAWRASQAPRVGAEHAAEPSDICRPNSSTGL